METCVQAETYVNMHGKRYIFYGTQEPAVKMRGKRVCMQKHVNIDGKRYIFTVPKSRP